MRRRLVMAVVIAVGGALAFAAWPSEGQTSRCTSNYEARLRGGSYCEGPGGYVR